jgi:hypothetical protein
MIEALYARQFWAIEYGDRQRVQTGSCTERTTGNWLDKAASSKNVAEPHDKQSQTAAATRVTAVPSRAKHPQPHYKFLRDCL